MFIPTWKWEGGVALVGAESSGKSTLRHKLVNQLQVPVVGEIVRGTLKTMELDVPPAYGCDFGLTAKFQATLQQEREREESRHRCFLADRSSIDSYAYTLACCGRDPKSQEWLKGFQRESVEYARRRYKLFIVVPSGKFPVVPDGIRNPLTYNAMMMHYMILGLLSAHNLPHYILQSVNIDCRTAEVLDTLQQYELVEEVDGGCKCGIGFLKS